MTITVEIQSAEYTVKSGNSARTGKPYAIREQVGYVKFSNQPYPVQIKLTLEDSAAPYAPGKYVLSDNSFFVGRFGDLQVRPRLEALPASVRQAS
jgi:hypothetical protein